MLNELDKHVQKPTIQEPTISDETQSQYFTLIKVLHGINERLDGLHAVVAEEQTRRIALERACELMMQTIAQHKKICDIHRDNSFVHTFGRDR